MDTALYISPVMVKFLKVTLTLGLIISLLPAAVPVTMLPVAPVPIVISLPLTVTPPPEVTLATFIVVCAQTPDIKNKKTNKKHLEMLFFTI
jgi:hypothetical protein